MAALHRNVVFLTTACNHIRVERMGEVDYGNRAVGVANKAAALRVGETQLGVS